MTGIILTVTVPFCTCVLRCKSQCSQWAFSQGRRHKLPTGPTSQLATSSLSCLLLMRRWHLEQGAHPEECMEPTKVWHLMWLHHFDASSHEIAPSCSNHDTRSKEGVHFCRIQVPHYNAHTGNFCLPIKWVWDLPRLESETGGWQPASVMSSPGKHCCCLKTVGAKSGVG